jgi:hypothetical protein
MPLTQKTVRFESSSFQNRGVAKWVTVLYCKFQKVNSFTRVMKGWYHEINARTINNCCSPDMHWIHACHKENTQHQNTAQNFPWAVQLPRKTPHSFYTRAVSSFEKISEQTGVATTSGRHRVRVSIINLLRPSDLPSFDHPNVIWKRVQTMKLLTVQFSPPSSYFIPLRHTPLSTLFSNTMNLCSFLWVGNQHL